MPGPSLRYLPLERLRLGATVARLPYLVERCRGRRVLDLGGYDETALAKQDTEHWLHGRIAAVAAEVLGIDSATALPPEGVRTGPRSRIVRGDVAALTRDQLDGRDFDVIVAGELIEHLPDTLAFFRQLRALFPGKEFLATTPNATALSNVLLGCLARESNHPDHLQVYSYKTLNTLCLRAGFEAWELRTYHVYFTEMALRSRGVRRLAVGAAEKLVNLGESLFPLLAGGLVLDVARL